MKSFKIPFLLLLAICHLRPYAFSAENPSIVLNHLHPIFLEWKDGRKATFKIKENKEGFVSFDFTVTENECTGKTDRKCRMTFITTMKQFLMEWIHHPQKDKIGKLIYSKKLGRKLLDLVYYNFVTESLYPGNVSDIPPSLTCDDYSWIPGGGPEAPPEEWPIHQWSTEELRNNLETNAFENQSNSGAFDLLFKKNEANSLSLKNLPFVFVAKQKEYMFYLALIADVVQLSTLDESRKNLCQITLRIDIPGFMKGMEEYNARIDPVGKILVYEKGKPFFETPGMHQQMSVLEIIKEVKLLDLE